MVIARKYINEHRVVHDYGLCAMVKTAQDGDLNAHVLSLSKLVACPQHQRELVQCHKMCLPDIQSLLFTQPFIQAQIKENIKAPRHWPLCGEFTGHR